MAEQKMTLEQLTEFFKYQLKEDPLYKPDGKIRYVLLAGQDRVNGEMDAKKISDLLTTLNDNKYQFEGYRDRTPVFLVREEIIPL